MPDILSKKFPSKFRRYQRSGPDCRMVDMLIGNLSDYFGVFNSLLAHDGIFWFRGHSDLRYTFAPSALRYSAESDRNRALEMLRDFRRFAEIRLQRPPDSQDELKWLQLAQHHGLPTRLLDWTENAAAALYFACRRPDEDGLVAVLNPIDLNRQVDALRPRIFDALKDSGVIRRYLTLTGRQNPRGRRTIAIYPIQNSERITLQKGVFTLHGSRAFGLDKEQVPSLIYLPILREMKESLLRELDRVGINEMALFPELEHICGHLKTKASLS